MKNCIVKLRYSFLKSAYFMAKEVEKVRKMLYNIFCITMFIIRSE